MSSIIACSIAGLPSFAIPQSASGVKTKVHSGCWCVHVWGADRKRSACAFCLSLRLSRCLHSGKDSCLIHKSSLHILCQTRLQEKSSMKPLQKYAPDDYGQLHGGSPGRFRSRGTCSLCTGTSDFLFHRIALKLWSTNLAPQAGEGFSAEARPLGLRFGICQNWLLLFLAGAVHHCPEPAANQAAKQ